VLKLRSIDPNYAAVRLILPCELLLNWKNGQYGEIVMSAQDAIDVFRRNTEEVQVRRNLEVLARGEAFQ
jgi:hypothetical protein